MRVGIDIRTNQRGASGQQRYLWQLGKALARAGHEPHFLTVKKLVPSGEPFPLHRFSEIKPSLRRRRVEDLGLDVLFGNPERAYGYPGLAFDVLRPGYGTRQGRQTLQTRRGRLSGWSYRAARLSPIVRSRMTYELAAYTAPSSPEIIAISRLMRSAIAADYEVSADRLHLIYNGVDLDEFGPGVRMERRAGLRARWEIPPERPCFLFVGHNFTRKGLPELLEAFAGLESAAAAHLIVAGAGTNRRQVAAVRRRAEQLRISSRVRWVGAVRAADAYAAADAFVLPSWHDAFGFVLLEAMAAGLPVVSTRLAGASELVREGEHGFVVDSPVDVSGMSDRMARLLDPALRRHMAEAARGLAEQHGEDDNLGRVIELIEGRAPGQARRPKARSQT